MRTIFAIVGDSILPSTIEGLLGRAEFSVAIPDRSAPIVDQVVAAKPRVILIDLAHDDGDRLRICRQLKANPATSRIPIVVLTAPGRMSQIQSGLESEADDHASLDDPPLLLRTRVDRLARFAEMADESLHNQRLIQVGRMLTGIVHEIRGPLAVIRGHAELLGLLLAGNQDALHWVDQLQHHSKLMQVRLAHLMSAVRAGAGPGELVPIVEVVAEALEFFAKSHDRRRSRIKLATEYADDFGRAEREYKVDSAKLLLVLLNILNNALESFESSTTPGSIRVQLGRETRAGRDGIRIDVIDDGPGIPESVLPHVFKPFFTTKGGGSGYGLFLSTEVLAEMGGTIEAANWPEGGACFTIWLPTGRSSSASLLDQR